MKNRFLISLFLGVIVALLAGCAYPVVTGGDVAFRVFVADPSRSMLSRTWNAEAEAAILVAESRPVSRFIVIPRYEGPQEPRTFRAQIASAEKNRISYPLRLHLATWEGREHLPWDVYPQSLSFVYAWVFAEGCWPVYAKERFSIAHNLLAANIHTRWGGWKNIPPSLEGEGTVVCFPLSHPWDREVAAAAGCEIFKYYLEDNDSTPFHVGDVESLWAMTAIPCWFIGAVDESKDLTDTDRLMVFRHVLRLYEQTKSYWMSSMTEIAGYSADRQQAYAKNTAMLQERIQKLKSEAAPPAVPAAK